MVRGPPGPGTRSAAPIRPFPDNLSAAPIPGREVPCASRLFSWCLLCKVVCVLSIFDEVTQITPGISETHGCRGRSLHRFHCSQPLYARHCTARPLDGWLSCPCRYIHMLLHSRKCCCSNLSGWASTALLGWCHMAFSTPFFLLASFMWLLLRWSSRLPPCPRSHGSNPAVPPVRGTGQWSFPMPLAPHTAHSAHSRT